MPEGCAMEAERGCLGTARLEMLEKRMDEVQDRNGRSHQEIFGRLNALERQGSVRDAQYQAIMEKLDKLVAWQEAQREKPVRRWENLADNAVWAVCAAVIAYMLAGLGL